MAERTPSRVGSHSQPRRSVTLAPRPPAAPLQGRNPHSRLLAELSYCARAVYENSVAVPSELLLVFMTAQKKTLACERILTGVRTAANINAAHNT